MKSKSSPTVESFNSKSKRKAFRIETLLSQGATLAVDELLTYNENIFKHENLSTIVSFPLPAEPHVAVWEEYAIEAATLEEVLPTLRSRIVQLQFPIQAGISETETYRAATRRGILPAPEDATGLQLHHPEKLQLTIYSGLAGPIPVLIAGDRHDFVALVQAFTARNEPNSIPDSMGATMIAGFNNWDRVRRYRQDWEAQQTTATEASWMAEFQRLVPQKTLYQDRVILLSQGPYSNITASELGLSNAEWQALSLKIRLEHEYTHYFTRRVLHSMQNNLLDELIADYRGIVAAVGEYRADWFLHFIGLESFPHYREGGRLQNYRGNPPLSGEGFCILQRLVKAAAENLEQFDRQARNQLLALDEQAFLLLALTTLTLEELASHSGSFLIKQAWQNQRQYWQRIE